MADEDEEQSTQQQLNILGANLSAMGQNLNVLFESIQSQFQQQDAQTLWSVWDNAVEPEEIIEFGPETKNPRYQDNPRATYMPGGARPEQVAEYQSRRYTGDPLQKTTRSPVTSRELLNKYVRMSRAEPEKFLQFQQQLFMGGFYPPSMSLDEIPFGTFDEGTLDAVYQLMAWTSRENEASPDLKLTTDQILSERAAKALGPLREALVRGVRGGGGGGGGGGRTVQLADAQGLAQGLNQMSTEILGRRATPDEQRMFVGIIHAMQSSGASPDMGGQAEAFLREQAPVEAGAHDVARTFEDFMDIIGGLGVM